MKKLLLFTLAALMMLASVACTPAPATTTTEAEAPAETAAEAPVAEEPAAEPKLIGYYKDAADDYYKAGYEVFAALAQGEGWEIIDVVGQGTAPEQIAAIENFIVTGVDAIVCVQNSPQASAECIEKANAAGIPIFFATHNPPSDPLPTGFAGYDWVQTGKYAGESASRMV